MGLKIVSAEPLISFLTLEENATTSKATSLSEGTGIFFDCPDALFRSKQCRQNSEPLCAFPAAQHRTDGGCGGRTCHITGREQTHTGLRCCLK